MSLSGAADIAQIALAAFALLALGGAVWQTSSVRKSAREALTYNYFVRFSDIEARRSLAMLLRINEGSDDERRRRFIEMSRAERLEALIVLNLCEELGGRLPPWHDREEGGEDGVRSYRTRAVERMWMACRDGEGGR